MSKPKRNKNTTPGPANPQEHQYFLHIEVDPDAYAFFKDYDLTMYNYKVDVSSHTYPIVEFGQVSLRSWVKGDFPTTLDLQARMVHKQ